MLDGQSPLRSIDVCMYVCVCLCSVQLTELAAWDDSVLGVFSCLGCGMALGLCYAAEQSQM